MIVAMPATTSSGIMSFVATSFGIATIGIGATAVSCGTIIIAFVAAGKSLLFVEV